MYQSIREEFGKNFGDYDVVIPVLCTLINRYQRIIADNDLKDGLSEKIANKSLALKIH